ncbi:NagD protein [Fervidobacterium changbaicum]|uniref:HAD-IIA family hydrolase n=2 Tax=Fervidobacterium TaxID=2422 RepID=A0AAI8GE02_FERIS|nr:MULTISPECIES: HAD-IIA family hydrolase [Fervidobacterium]AMW33649.2 HAD-IIA family hydrolase [Fervidobacterium islandicum]QAV33927.1 HAD family hydrolase [Fervidobacterium changbaicum]SDH56251.1 NagD protein [Fervidobacterium changbaicum]
METLENSREMLKFQEIKEKGKENIKNCKLFILDIDGTFYLSGRLFDGSKKFVEALEKLGKKLVFLTNNSNRTIDSYIDEFSKMGIKLTRDQIVTAGVATAEYLYEEFGPKKVYIVGTEDIKYEFSRLGHSVVEEDPEVVVVTFDKTLTYEKVKKATQFISKGALFVVTNPDLNCPSSEGPLPDAGAIASLIRKASGAYPNIIFGKPEPKLLEMVIRHNNVSKEETCMVGDRLYTDILAGIQAGTWTVLVLTGEATVEQVQKSPIKPHLIARDIGVLADILLGEI